MPVSDTFIRGKVVLVGDCGVGKTSLINAYHRDSGPPATTVAANSVPMKVELPGDTVQLTVWDTAGQDDYHCLIPLYVRLAHVAVVVFSVDKAESFQQVDTWLNSLDGVANVPHIILVGNKIDLPGVIDPSLISAKATELSVQYYRTSAVTFQGVDDLFAGIAQLVLSDAHPVVCEEIVDFSASRPVSAACRC
jgi:small GTP-binding protein